MEGADIDDRSHDDELQAEKRSLLGLKLAQFCGAFNDNAWKMLVILLAGRVAASRGAGADEVAAQSDAMAALVAFTLPLFLFSLPAGSLVDRFAKRTTLIATKACELALMAIGAVLLARLGSADAGATASLVVLGAMGAQTAFFSPAKYGVLPEIVPHRRLSAANGALEAFTFAAIIAGSALGPKLVADWTGAPWQAAAILAAIAFVGLVAVLRVKPTGAPPIASAPASLREVIGLLRADRTLLLALIGGAWFWTIASLLGQDLLVWSRTHLMLAEGRTGVPLGAFGIGMGIGSVLAGRVSGDKVELGLIPLGAVFLGACTLALGVVAPMLAGTLMFLLLLGIASGLVIVPIDALTQWRAPAERRGAVIAFGNVLAFFGVLLGSLIGFGLSRVDVSARGILIAAAAITLAGTAWAVWLLPQALFRLLIFLATHTLYRLRVLGREHVPSEGGVLLAPNHVSFADGLFLIAALDRPVRFVVDQDQFQRRWLKPFLKLLDVIPVSANAEPRALLHALRTAGEALDRGEIVCIFPEGQITRTGQLQPFRRGLERIAKGRDAVIVPVHLDRVWGSVFSYSGGRFVWKAPERLPYPVTVSFGPPRPPDTALAEIRAAVVALEEEAWRVRGAERGPLHRAFVRAARRRPFRVQFVEENRPPVSRFRVLAGAVALARKLRPTLDRAGSNRNVGILLPPSTAGALANLAVTLSGRVAVNLNFTVGPSALESAVRQSALAFVITSRPFLEQVKVALPASVTVIDIAEVLGSIGGRDRFVAGLLAALAPSRWLERACGATKRATPSDVAAILFSSGSSAEPKGVMLAHSNLDSNVAAVAQVFRVRKDDRVLGILPLFHSFGYLSLWFSLHSGAALVFHPNPLDAAAVGRLVLRFRVTMLLATPTFLALYLRRCTSDQFGSLRIVMAGAERLTDALADAFEEQFGIRPYEGYGATECSPVIAAGVPSFRAPGFFQPGRKAGFIGPALPGVRVAVVDPETFAPREPGEEGLLIVRGPNVMQGYLGREDLTRAALKDGWYVTGDLGIVDADGWVRVTDRLSRFSKIGGEMVPHGKVEDALNAAAAARGRTGGPWFVVTAVPDEKKGERLAVLSRVPREEIGAILDQLAGSGLPNLFLPRADAFVPVDAFPMLGTGKLDLRAVRTIAASALAATRTDVTG